MGPNKDGWCDFHRAFGHSTEDYWSLKTQIEKLVQEGHLSWFIRRLSNEGHEAAQARRRGRSRSWPKVSTWHRGTMTTIARRGGIFQEGASRRIHEVQTVLTGTNPVLTFDDRDLKHGVPIHDELMVKSVIAIEYRIEWVLCSGTLYVFAGERVPIKGTVELETVFGECSWVRAIPILYTVVDAESSYNIIMGRPVLNRLGAVISTYHLCMKFPVGQKVGSVWADSHVSRRCYEDSLRVGSHLSETTKPIVNVLDLDLDPRCQYEHEGPHPAEDLKEIQLRPLTTHITKIGTTLSPKEEACLVSFLRRNNDVFVWTTKNMPLINPKFMCHRLLVAQGVKSVSQNKRKQGEEKRRAAREETNKLLVAVS
ncbi:hypothetical protein CR513_10503, partial [Mucuna pruriens]